MLELKQNKINIIGTEYKIIKKSRDEEEYFKNATGYCDFRENKIVYLDLDTDEDYKQDSKLSKNKLVKETIRHEIIHAFLFESGLNTSSLQLDGAWARNEEMVDWFAIQSPKIFKIYQELELL